MITGVHKALPTKAHAKRLSIISDYSQQNAENYLDTDGNKY